MSFVPSRVREPVEAQSRDWRSDVVPTAPRPRRRPARGGEGYTVLLPAQPSRTSCRVWPPSPSGGRGTGSCEKSAGLHSSRERVFGIEVLLGACGGQRRIIAEIEAAPVARQILARLDWPTEPPKPVPSSPKGLRRGTCTQPGLRGRARGVCRVVRCAVRAASQRGTPTSSTRRPPSSPRDQAVDATRSSCLFWAALIYELTRWASLQEVLASFLSACGQRS